MISGVPEAGDIVIINFNPQAGTEISKRRPGLVISAHSFNKALGQAWIYPITSKTPKHGFHVEIPDDVEGFQLATGPGEVSNVKMEQLRSLDFRSLRAVYAGKVSSEFLTQCRSYAIRVLEG